MMGSGAKELSFVTRNVHVTARIWRERIRIKGSKITDEEVRRGFLELLDPDTMQDVARILIFTDSTVSIFASRHRHSNSPELQCVLDELEITLMEFGIELTLKHLPGDWMIRLHVDAASRCNPGPLLAVRGPMDVHPYVIHEFGLTMALRRTVQTHYLDVVFVKEWVQLLDWSLRGKTLCFCRPRPDALLPIAMTALKIWTARPWSTRVIMLVARDFNTPNLRPILRQFDVVPGDTRAKRRYHRLLSSGDRAVWDIP
jgi:hypothetical protein